MMWRKKRESDLERELRNHLDLEAEEAGSADAAQRALGNTMLIKEEVRDMWGWTSIDRVGQDLRYAARLLRRFPGFTLTAVIVIAIGIGANSAIFSLVDTLLLRPLPYPQSDRIMKLWEHPPGYARNSVAPLNYQDWHDQNQSFVNMAAIAGGSRTLSTPNGAERIPGQSVTSGFFDLFRVAPIAGRTFVDADSTSGAPVVVISERLWNARFGRDLGIVGRTILLNQVPTTVIGIMPAWFQVSYEADLWNVFAVKRTPDQRQTHFLQVFGRLKDGLTPEQANANLQTIASGIAAAYPESNKNWTITLDTLRQSIVGDDLRTTSLVLAGVSAFILLMGCANVASLLLARGIGRSREIAVRASLGVTPARLVQQLLTESLLLSILGGLAGGALAWAIVTGAPTLLPPGTLPVGLQLSLDLRVVAFAALATLGVGVLFGLAPAWQAIRMSLADTLRAGGRSASSGAGLRTALAAAEIAVAVMLAAGAGLLLRTLGSLNGVDPGFSAANIVTAQVSLPGNRYKTTEQTSTFYRRLDHELAAIPGVLSVALGTNLPAGGWDLGQPFEVIGHPAKDSSSRPAAHFQMVNPSFFQTFGIKMVWGRSFTERDTAQAPPVCIVNEEFIRRNLEGKDPVGVHVKVDDMDAGKPVEREIVGVIRQVKVEGLTERDSPLELYVPVSQNSFFSSAIALHTAGSPLAMVPAMKEAIARIDKDLPLTRIRTMEEVEAQSIAQPRFRAQIVATFAGFGLVLAAVGIFGVLAFSVGQRTREFGIRMALGAQAADVMRLVLRLGLRIVTTGVAAGLIGAMFLTRSLESLLYGVKPLDPLAFAGATAMLCAVAMAACAAPALRASRVNPAITLRQE